MLTGEIGAGIFGTRGNKMFYHDGCWRAYGDQGTTTAATTLTTDNTTGTAYIPLQVDDSGVLNINSRSWFYHNDECGSPIKWSEPKSGKFIDQLRREIADWHGDILRTA
jgi:hypothetical protein